MYLYRRDVEAFRIPLAELLWRGIPAWFAGSPEPAETPEPEAPTRPAAEAAPTAPGLREVVAPVVACVLALLSEVGLLQTEAAARPTLPGELHPAAAPTLAPGEIAGAWQRPPMFGPRAAVKRAFLELLERS